MKIILLLLNIIIVLFLVQYVTFAATGEVTKEGNIWTAAIDNDTVYSGSNMMDAINACCSNMDAGTINVRNSGESGPSGGNIKSCNLFDNQTVDFHGNTMHCTDELQIVPVRAQGKSNISVKNLNVTGTPRYVIWFTNGCKNITLTNITANTTRGNGIRVTDEGTSNLTINGKIDIHTVGHAIETYDIDTVNIGTVNVQADKGCGVLLNYSRQCEIDTIYAKLCDYGSSYAGFRQANGNGPTHCKYLRADSCGRGLYTLTNSHDVTIDSVSITNCSTAGISSAGTAYNVYVNSGIVSNTLSGKDVDIWDGASFICIKVNGESYGDGCDSNNFGTIEVWLETECGTIGSFWNISEDNNASNGKYVTVQLGKNRPNSASENITDLIEYDFNVSESGKYTVWGRVITPTTNDDSFWVRLDGGSWFQWNNIGPANSWTWEHCKIFELSSGDHTITFAYREDGALLDKILITNTNNEPTNLGGKSDSVCNTQIVGITELWLEAECSSVGSSWDIIPESNASNNTYVTGRSGIENFTPPTNANDYITYSFNINEESGYTIWGRVITPGSNNDAFWMRMDGGTWLNWNNIGTNSEWTWVKNKVYNLSAGEHTLTVAISEDGALIDKLLITNKGVSPSGLGGEPDTVCIGHNATSLSSMSAENVNIYPNPTSNFINVDLIDLSDSEVNIEIINKIGKNISHYSTNKSNFSINVESLVPGIYILRISNNREVFTGKFIKK